MKKVLILVLCLLLAAAVLPCALAAQGDANLAMDLNDQAADSIYGGCVLGDTLYLQGYQGLYVWKPGEADVTAYPYDIDRYHAVDSQYSNVQNIATDGEKLYAILSVTSMASDGSDGYEQTAEIRELTLEDGKVVLGEATGIDAGDLKVENRYGSYISSFNSCTMVGDTFFGTVWDDNGNQKLYSMKLDGSTSPVDIENVYMFAPYKDGQLLVETYDYNGGGMTLCAYDPESESVTTLTAQQQEEQIYGIAYSTETDRLFFLKDGYIMAAENFDLDNAQQVGQLSSNYYSDAAGLLMPGDFYVYITYDVTCVRNTDPEALPSETITVMNANYIGAVVSAYYSFGNTHPDTGVVISNGGMDDKRIIDAMMNRDSSVDIYSLGVSMQAYDSLFNRGYIAELNDSQLLTDAVEKMYPGIREALERDGKIVAIPIGIYGDTLGYNAEAFEKIGVSADEIPDNWPEFLELLKSLEGKLPEDGSVKVFNGDITVSDARSMMVDAIFSSYASYLDVKGQETGYNTPELRSMLEAALQLDYEALGFQPDQETTDEGTVYYSGMVTIGGTDSDSNQKWLLETYTSCTLGNMYGDTMPLLLSVVKGEEAPVPARMTVAFINPFTEHMDAALAFMEEIYKQLPNEALYNFSDALNEPVRYSGYEASRKEMEKYIAEITSQLETADPVDKPVLEQNKKAMEDGLADYEKNSWLISAAQIEWYRNHADRLHVTRYNYLDGTGDENNIYEMKQQMVNGQMSVDSFLQEIDRTARMMAMEGN